MILYKMKMLHCVDVGSQLVNPQIAEQVDLSKKIKMTRRDIFTRLFFAILGCLAISIIIWRILLLTCDFESRNCEIIMWGLLIVAICLVLVGFFINVKMAGNIFEQSMSKILQISQDEANKNKSLSLKLIFIQMLAYGIFTSITLYYCQLNFNEVMFALSITIFVFLLLIIFVSFYSASFSFAKLGNILKTMGSILLFLVIVSIFLSIIYMILIWTNSSLIRYLNWYYLMIILGITLFSIIYELIRVDYFVFIIAECNNKDIENFLKANCIVSLLGDFMTLFRIILEIIADRKFNNL